MLLLGISSNLYSSKAIVFDTETSTIIAQAEKAYSIQADPHPYRDPHDWIVALESTVSICLERLGSRRKDIRALGISALHEGYVLLDDKDQVIMPTLLHLVEETSSAVEELSHAFAGTPGFIERTGLPLHSAHLATKLLWLKKQEKAHFQKIATVLLPNDYLNFWLTGIKSGEHGNASTTGLFDVRNRCWHASLIEFIDSRLENALLHPQEPSAFCGMLKQEIAQRWGLSKNIVVSVGSGERMMRALACGNIRPGILTVHFGTKGSIHTTVSEPMVDDQGDLITSCDATGKWMLSHEVDHFTDRIHQVRSLFGWNMQEMEENIKAVPTGAKGLSFISQKDSRQSSLYGLTLKNSEAKALGRAAVEAAVYQLAIGVARMKEMGVKISEIRLMGAARENNTWRQLIADVFNQTVVSLRSAAGPELGAAIHAAYCYFKATEVDMTFRELCDYMVRVEDTSYCAPLPENQELHREKLQDRGRLVARERAMLVH